MKAKPRWMRSRNLMSERDAKAIADAAEAAFQKIRIVLDFQGRESTQSYEELFGNLIAVLALGKMLRAGFDDEWLASAEQSAVLLAADFERWKSESEEPQ